jgi:hypothetical protein
MIPNEIIDMLEGNGLENIHISGRRIKDNVHDSDAKTSQIVETITIQFDTTYVVSDPESEASVAQGV